MGQGFWRSPLISYNKIRLTYASENQMQYSLRHLRYFAAAADHESVTLAAHALGVSQPAVSTAIAELEVELGTILFLRRHARGLALTAAGRRIAAEARRLLAHAAEFDADARGQGGRLAGMLDLGCFVTLAPFFLPQLMLGFARRHPAISIRLHEGDLATLAGELERGHVELALLYDLGLGKGLTLTRLAEVAPHVILPAGDRLARLKRVPLERLLERPMVLLDLPHSRDYFQSLFVTRGVAPSIRHRSASFELVRALVGQGHGYALLNLRPRGDRTYDGGRVICRPLAERLPALSIVLARPAKVKLTGMADAFASHVQDWFARADLNRMMVSG